MDLQFDLAEVATLSAQLTDLAEQLSAVSAHTTDLGLRAAGPAPGVKDLARGHGEVLAGSAGSAATILQTISAGVEWVGKGLLANAAALAGHQQLVAFNLEHAADGISIPPESVTFPPQPDQTYSGFVFPVPTAAGGGSISTLKGQFAAMNQGAIGAGAARWGQLTSEVGRISADLRQTAHQLSDCAKGDAFTGGIGHLEKLAERCNEFATNCVTMRGACDDIATIITWARSTLSEAEAALAALPDPALRPAEEAALVAAFTAQLQASCSAAVPQLTALVTPSQSGGAGGDNLSAASTGGIGAAGPIGDVGTQIHNLAGQAAAGLDNFATTAAAVDQGLSAVNQALQGVLPGTGTSPVLPTLPQGLGAGIGPNAGSALPKLSAPQLGGTKGLSGGGVSLPPLSSPTLGSAKLTAGSNPALGATSKSLGSASTTSASSLRVPNLSGLSTDNLTTTSATAAPVAPGLGGAGNTGAAAAGRGAGMKKRGSGSGGAGSLGLPSKPGSLTQPSAPNLGAGGSFAGTSPAGSSGATSTTATGMRGGGMMPLAGAGAGGGAAGSKQKKRPVKAVLGQVEQDLHLQDLLGDGPQMIRGPIGDWARG